MPATKSQLTHREREVLYLCWQQAKPIAKLRNRLLLAPVQSIGT